MLFGLEREAIRITPNGTFATTPHPEKLGDKLTHPFITTDFAESQLELQTPPHKTVEEALDFLTGVHIHTANSLDDELMWPFSMPPVLPETIQPADYGPSDMGRAKTDYRNALVKRYGRNMQLISGIHFNMSFPNEMCDSEGYMAVVRNFLRYGWLISYLFGASPNMDPSYGDFEVSPYATSLRMSRHGYYSRIQCQNALSTDSVKAYKKDLQAAIESGLMQNANEHYTRIRHKGNYVEVRALDINPFSPVGVTIDQLHFLKTFLTYCLLKESPLLNKNAQYELCKTQDIVATDGRNPKHQFGKQAKLLLDEIRTVTKTPLHFDEYYAMCQDPELTLSGQLAKKGSFLEYGLTQAKALSLKGKKTSVELLDGLEMSTQLLIKSAYFEGYPVEIIDRRANIIRIGKEIVKQATITRLDSQLVHELMGNKQATKKILLEAGFPVPAGEAYTTEEIDFVKNAVVKPNTTNYGQGVHFPDTKEDFIDAVKDAFTFDGTILVEERVPGKEHRFLIMNGECIAVLRREGASVTGDGTSTLDQLAKKANLTLGLSIDPTYIPKKDERAPIRKNSNVSTGGIGIDVTDTIDPKFKELAIKATKAMGATICGVDLMINEKSAVIIEMNYNPMLSMHAFPYHGEGRNVTKPLLHLIMAN
ncbi:MAG: Glutathione biosynthesis bifunctional protein GshAB [Chlamydiia bacterium]|nr:Glutathione biosynthesis bifunctional protein GshAB [Chlamydiia bacterium]MCH9615485.1 Glutathione biosynthesis bifunctional protein GshAB [Chlamydiia bacterium]MCH9629140.1 Glutathione biosynthesis bifunctional protein GshAB [Chlamydiia bacterium]